MRRIIVPTTCCTRLAPRAGDLLLHRSFSSIYLQRDKKTSQRHSPSGQTPSGAQTNEEQMKRSGGRKHNKKPFRSLVRQNIRWQHCALVKLASCLLRFYIQSVQSALNAMNNQICGKRVRRQREKERALSAWTTATTRNALRLPQRAVPQPWGVTSRPGVTEKSHTENLLHCAHLQQVLSCSLSASPGLWGSRSVPCKMKNAVVPRRRQVSAESGPNLTASSPLFSLSVS